MPSTPMYRVVQVANGVAGTPYYLTGYFDASAGTAQQAATAWRAMLGDLAGNFVSPYRYESISTVDTVDPATGNTTGVLPVSVGSLQFTDSSDPLPPATTLLIRWRTGVYSNGREIRGRTNISRLSESLSSDGAPSAASLTAWQTRVTNLLSNVTAKHVVYSKSLGRWELTASGGPRNTWCVLRSRRD